MKTSQVSKPQSDRRTATFKNAVEVLSVGVDWLTVTQKHGPEAEIIRATALGLADVELHNGMYGRPWGANGYEGFSVGHLEYGERNEDVICRVHGDCSHAHWHRLYALCRNVSRIDLEVTVRTSEDPRFVVRRHLRELQRSSRSLKRGPQVEYKVDHQGGMTVYSGNVQSARRLRIYDKERESGSPLWAGCVRYEAQYNGKKGLWATSALYGREDFYRRIGALVLGFVQERGGRCGHLLNRFTSGSDVSTPQPYPMQPTDAERTLRWFEKSVAPAARRVVELKGQQAVLESLGLA